MVRIVIAAVTVGVIVFTAGACGSECSADKDCEEVVCPDGTKHRSCSEGLCMVFADCNTKPTGW